MMRGYHGRIGVKTLAWPCRACLLVRLAPLAGLLQELDS